MENRFYDKLHKDEKTGEYYIEREFALEQPKQIVKVREYAPRVVNFVFSSSANQKINLVEARKQNIKPTLDLFVKAIKSSDQF